MSEIELLDVALNLSGASLSSEAFETPLGEINLHEIAEADANIKSEIFIGSGFETEMTISDRLNLKSKFGIICRFCLSESEYMTNLLDVETFILEMVSSMIAIQIDTDDILPKKICPNCYDILSKFFAFKQQIEAADVALRHCLVSEEDQGIEPDKNENSKSKNKELDIVITPSDGETMKDKKDTNWENVEMLDDLIEEKYDPGYMMIYETDPATYSDCETDDEASLVEKDPQKPDGNLVLFSSSEQEPSSQEIQPEIMQCEICCIEFNDQSLFSKHAKSHENNQQKYICPICRKSFQHSSNLQCHLASHQSATKGKLLANFKCTKCDCSFAIEKDLFIHESIHSENEKFQCRECLKEFPNLPKLRRHVKTHYEDKPIKCEECGRGFPEMASLTRHYRVHTNQPRERKHVCKECGKAYSDSHSLSIHVRTHTGEKPWACTKCDKRFIDSRLLNSHMRTHMNIRKHSCKLCEKSFTHRSTLVTHLRTHTGEKPFVCNVCNKSFIQSSNLLVHLRVHSGEKRYKCSKCPKAFASSSTLSLHLRTHTSEKPFSCKLCGKNFARHNLTIHMRTHTGEKPYDCTECLRKFTTSGQLAQHKRTHTGDKPYSCKICGKKWATSSYLKKHMQTHVSKVGLAEESFVEPTDTTIQEKNDPYNQQNHRIRIEEIQSDAEFNENAILVNDLLASVVNVNADVLQGGNVEIPELSSYDSNHDLGELRNVINPNRFNSSSTNEGEEERVFVTEA